MPLINGPNEGLLGGVLLSFTSWWYGPMFWQGTEWCDTLRTILPIPNDLRIRNCDIVVIAASIGFAQEILIKTSLVTRRYSSSMVNLLPFFVLSSCYFLIGYWAPTIWLSLPRTSLHLAMLLFVEMSTELMLAHVTAQSFSPWRRWQLIPLVVLTILVGLGRIDDQENGAKNDLIQYWIVAYTLSLASFLLFKIVFVIREICNTLQIWCFDIVTPNTSPSTIHGEGSTGKED